MSIFKERMALHAKSPVFWDFQKNKNRAGRVIVSLSPLPGATGKAYAPTSLISDALARSKVHRTFAVERKTGLASTN
jgi:hypothetical protein